MGTYRRIGSTPAIEALGAQLEGRGARVARANDSTDLTVVGATTIEEGMDALERLAAGERARTVLVGIDAPLDIWDRPVPGSFAYLLETYQPLGVLRTGGWETGSMAGFVGRKELARALDTNYLNRYSSRNYASWMKSTGSDAAEFLLRMIDALERSGSVC